MTSLTNWEGINITLTDADKMSACFDDAIQVMYHKYIGGQVRDTQMEFFKTLRKPIKSDPLTPSRMLTLAIYGNKLPGMEPELIDAQVKACIFHSFPQSW
jgi:hypothetical protein